MQNFIKIFLILALFQSTSCAYFFNSKEVEISIASNPPGADIIIEGRNYGQTPKLLIIEPKNYDVLLSIPNYGSTNVKLATWQTSRDRDGDGERCVADAVGFMFILPLMSAWSVYCRDFKEKNIFINIPQNNTGLNRPLPNDFYEINQNFQERKIYNLPQKTDYRQNLDSYRQIDNEALPNFNNTTNNRLNSRNLTQTYDPFASDNLQYPHQIQYRYNSQDIAKTQVAPQRDYIKNDMNQIGENMHRQGYRDAVKPQEFPGKIQESQPYESYENLDQERRSIDELYLEDMKKNMY